MLSLSLLNSAMQQSAAKILSLAISKVFDIKLMSIAGPSGIESSFMFASPSPSASPGFGVFDLDRGRSAFRFPFDLDGVEDSAGVAIILSVWKGSRSSPTLTLRSRILKILDSTFVSMSAILPLDRGVPPTFGLPSREESRSLLLGRIALPM